MTEPAPDADSGRPANLTDPATPPLSPADRAEMRATHTQDDVGFGETCCRECGGIRPCHTLRLLDALAAAERALAERPQDGNLLMRTANAITDELSGRPYDAGLDRILALVPELFDAGSRALAERDGAKHPDSIRFDKLWRALPLPIRHRFGGDEHEAREGVDALPVTAAARKA